MHVFAYRVSGPAGSSQPLDQRARTESERRGPARPVLTRRRRRRLQAVCRRDHRRREPGRQRGYLGPGMCGRLLGAGAAQRVHPTRHGVSQQDGRPLGIVGDLGLHGNCFTLGGGCGQVEVLLPSVLHAVLQEQRAAVETRRTVSSH